MQKTWVALAKGPIVALTIAAAGCATPSYHLPAGFSSSYHRHLYGMEPADDFSGCDTSTASLAQRKIFYPETPFGDRSGDRMIATESKRIEPIMIGQDSPRPPQTVRRPSSDTF